MYGCMYACVIYIIDTPVCPVAPESPVLPRGPLGPDVPTTGKDAGILNILNYFAV